MPHVYRLSTRPPPPDIRVHYYVFELIFFSVLAFGQQYITHIFIQSLEKSRTPHFHQIAIKLLKIIRDSDQVSIRQIVPVSYFFVHTLFVVKQIIGWVKRLSIQTPVEIFFFMPYNDPAKIQYSAYFIRRTLYWKHPSNFVRIQGHISSIVIKTFHFRLKCMFSRVQRQWKMKRKKSV